jgi:hypothetical protein
LIPEIEIRLLIGLEGYYFVAVQIPFKIREVAAWRLAYVTAACDFSTNVSGPARWTWLLVVGAASSTMAFHEMNAHKASRLWQCQMLHVTDYFVILFD